jgi:hypothetical protein
LHRAVELPAQDHLSNRVGMRRHRIRCLEVGSALRAALVVAAHSQVPGLSHQVPGSGVQHQVQVRARTRTRT